ncbi:uncharacterized protein LOC133491427 isoform X9 [Syngnathoides biaculeatus]|uniref:uncharacterized protein LOC133491427 isoform X9 n=1 Tax=Syngnathoides biaculeatus TaxID=300417 RepID=UPI002ADDA1F4|nr:uncharacterized protein LOC133491427 isoform X9 [Syngnathoides biaculeatus]
MPFLTRPSAFIRAWDRPTDWTAVWSTCDGRRRGPLPFRLAVPFPGGSREDGGAALVTLPRIEGPRQPRPGDSGLVFPAHPEDARAATLGGLASRPRVPPAPTLGTLRPVRIARGPGQRACGLCRFAQSSSQKSREEGLHLHADGGRRERPREVDADRQLVPHRPLQRPEDSRRGRADRSDGQHAQADGQHRGERRQVAAEHRRHAGLRRRRRQHAKVSALRRPARLHAFIFPHPVFPSARQLEASGGLRGAAVRTVLQGRERLGPQEHPGQPRTLLPLLHLSLWTRTATTGRRVLAGLARQSQHRSRAGQSRQPDAGRGAPEEEQGGALTLMLAWSRAPSMTASTRVFRRRSARSSDASGSTSTSSPAATLTTTTTSRGGTGCSRFPRRVDKITPNGVHRVTAAVSRALQDSVPFAVIGSNVLAESRGRRVKGRTYPWGVAEVESPAHSDFLLLRDMLLACQISRRRCRRHPAAAGRLRRGQGSIHLGGRPGVTGSHNRRMNGPPVAGLDEPGLCTSTAKRSFRSPRSHLRIGGSRNRQHDDARCGLSPPGGSDVQAAATPRIPLHPLSRSLLFPFLTLTAAVSTALYWSSIIHRLCIVRKIQ